MDEEIRDRIEQGVGLMGLERYEQAKELFKQVVGVDRRNAEAYLHLGNACMNLGELDEAEDAFKKALMADASSTQAMYSLGCVYFMKDDYGNAIRYFNRVEDAGAATVDMYGIEAAMFVQSDSPVMAVRCMNRAIKLEPLNPGPRMEKAEIYLTMGQRDDAIQTLHELQELLPDVAEGYITEVEVLLDGDQGEAALKVADHALERFPEDPRLIARKARVLNELGRYEDALAESQRAKEMGTQLPDVAQEVALQEGIAYAGLGKLEDSAHALEDAASGPDAAAQTAYLLMNECLMLQEFERGLSCAQKILEGEDVPPRIRASAIYNRAFALDKLGRAEEAAEAYRAATRDLRHITMADPGLVDVFVYRVMAHRAVGELEKALELIDYVISVDGGSAPSLAIKSEVLRDMGEVKESNKLRRRVRAVDPNYTFGE